MGSSAVAKYLFIVTVEFHTKTYLSEPVDYGAAAQDEDEARTLAAQWLRKEFPYDYSNSLHWTITNIARCDTPDLVIVEDANA